MYPEICSALCFHPGGRFLAAGFESGYIRYLGRKISWILKDIDIRTLETSKSVKCGNDPIIDLAVNEDGIIVVITKNIIYVIDSSKDFKLNILEWDGQWEVINTFLNCRAHIKIRN